MKIHKTNLDEYLKNFRLIIGNSDIKFRKHEDKIATWPDSGDVLTINAEKNKLLSVKITREEYAEEKNLTPEKKEEYTFEFDAKEATAKVREISDHLIFVDIKNIKLPTNIPNDSNFEDTTSYDLEMVIRCDCGFNLRTKKHHTTFFFYKDGVQEGMQHSKHSETEPPSSSGGGGGWTKQ